MLCPLPAYAQGGGEAPPGGTQTPAPVAPELVVERPGGEPLIREGQTNRQLLGGTWYFRQDDAFVGESERWFEQDDLAGWTPISGPPQLERHRHPVQPLLDRLVPQGVHAATLAEGGAALLEGALRGQQLPHRGLAQRQEASPLHRLLPVRGAAVEPARGTQHARRRGVVAAQQHGPHSLAARGVQRLRHWRLVELRRHPARGLHAEGGHRGRGARGGAAPAPARRRAGEGGGAAPRCGTSRARTATCP